MKRREDRFAHETSQLRGRQARRAKQGAVSCSVFWPSLMVIIRLSCTFLVLSLEPSAAVRCVVFRLLLAVHLQQ